MGAVAADAFDGEVLDRAQQLGLGRQREVGDLVEKQGAAVGMLELAAAAADAGRGPFLDAEQFGFEEGFNQGGAIDRDERPLPPATEVVDLPSDQLFADPAFPFQEYGEVGSRYTFNLRTQHLNGRSRADQRRSTVSF